MVEGGLDKALKEEQEGTAVAEELARIEKIGDRIPAEHKEAIAAYQEQLEAGDVIDPDTSSILEEIEAVLAEQQRDTERGAEEVSNAGEENLDESQEAVESPEKQEGFPSIQEAIITVEGQNDIIENIENYRARLLALMQEKVGTKEERDEIYRPIKRVIKDMYKALKNIDQLPLEQRKAEGDVTLLASRKYTQAINMMVAFVESLSGREIVREKESVGSELDEVSVSTSDLEKMQAEMDNAKGGDVEISESVVEQPPGSDIDLEDTLEEQKLAVELKGEKKPTKPKKKVVSTSENTEESVNRAPEGRAEFVVSDAEWSRVDEYIEKLKVKRDENIKSMYKGDLSEMYEEFKGKQRLKKYKEAGQIMKSALAEVVLKFSKSTEDVRYQTNRLVNEFDLWQLMIQLDVKKPLNGTKEADNPFQELEKLKDDSTNLSELERKNNFVDAFRNAVASLVLERNPTKVEKSLDDASEEKDGEKSTDKAATKKPTPKKEAGKKSKQTKTRSKKEKAANDPFAALDAALDEG